jgi:hypothetical protein
MPTEIIKSSKATGLSILRKEMSRLIFSKIKKRKTGVK